MMDIIDSFKSLVKVRQIDIDNQIFKLHYKFTVIMLLVFSALLMSKQYFGDPISCDVENNDRKALIDTYCWIYGTYIIKRNVEVFDTHLAGLGADPSSIVRSLKMQGDEVVVWQKYYQWVSIIFCLQALLFYMPHFLWKIWEDGRMQLLVENLRGPLVKSTWGIESRDELVQYLISGRYTHALYAYRYTLCELLNLINVCAQIYFMDWFLTGQFSVYGFSIATFADINHMNQVFPKLSKCQYFRFGASGSPESRDALCVLPLNVLNEKLFLTLWFWLFTLAFLTLIAVMYRALILMCPRLRAYVLLAQARELSVSQANQIIREISYGDFFVLNIFSKNVNPIIYREVVVGIYDASISFNKRRNKYSRNERNISSQC